MLHNLRFSSQQMRALMSSRTRFLCARAAEALSRTQPRDEFGKGEISKTAYSTPEGAVALRFADLQPLR